MPVKIYWEVCDLLKQAAYLISSQEHNADVQEVYRRVFKVAAPYAIFESDRAWLLRRGESG